MHIFLRNCLVFNFPTGVGVGADVKGPPAVCGVACGGLAGLGVASALVVIGENVVTLRKGK